MTTDAPRILAIDGGGVRGLVAAMVLCEIEERTGRRTAELFDVIAGTSTGGIIAAFVSLPARDGRAGRPAHEVAEFYTEECPKIFHQSLRRKLSSVEGVLDEKYSPEALERSLHTYIGEDAMLSDAVCELVLPAFDLEGREPFFFKSSRAKREPARDYPMWLAARATSAAPTYFEPVPLKDPMNGRTFALIDGGVYVNNPGMCAYAEVCSGTAMNALLVSLGTGMHTEPITYMDARNWGLAKWARPILSVVLDGVSASVDHQLDQLLGDRHVRFQTELTVASQILDDASPENLENLKEQGRLLIAERSDELDRVCQALVG